MGKHSEWRKLAKKVRRKRVRTCHAIARQSKEEEEQKRLEASPTYHELLKKCEDEEAFELQEATRLKEVAENRWHEVEKEAQKQWVELQKKVEVAREERARQNALIKLEWEREEKRLREIKDTKEKELEEMENQQKLLQEQVTDFIDNGGDTPEHLKVAIEMNPSKPICPFFQKTATCRFRDMCSRNHIKPGVSRILLIPNFYSHYSLEQSDTEHGDSSLEFENHETYFHFKEFFFDVLPEMEQYGRVRQFKVCCNHELHLRGNVYVEYSSTREAVKSYKVFNGRWYGGRQLNVEFCKIDSWKSAICGLHFRRKCPKGSTCNFLHVFQNPKGLFQSADQDMHRTPPPKSIRRESERRDWRWSESPERLTLDDLDTKLIQKKSHRTSRHKSSSRKRSRSRSRTHEHSSRRKDPKRSRRETRC